MLVQDAPVASGSSRWRSFRRGMLQRSPLVLAAAALVCLLAVLAVHHFFFGGGMTGVSEGRLLRITHDDYVHVVYKVNQLKKHPPDNAVYVFGGSGAMEAVVGERSFARQIEAAAGEPVSVVSLANHAQSLAQNLVIVDNLPRGRALLLIGIAPMRFNTPPAADRGLLTSRPLLLQSPRLEGLASELYDAEAPQLAAGIPGAFDFISSYMRQRLRSGPFPGVPLRYQRHYYGRDAEPASPLAKRLTLRSVFKYNRTNYAANHAYNLTMLDELLRLSRERGFTPVLFEQPLNTIVAGDWAGVLPKYRAAVTRVAAAHDTPYLHIQERLGLRDEDFADLYHLMPPARARWQAEMARELGALLAAERDAQR